MPKLSLKKAKQNHPSVSRDWITAVVIISFFVVIFFIMVKNSAPQSLTGQIKLPKINSVPIDRPSINIVPIKSKITTTQENETPPSNSEQAPPNQGIVNPTDPILIVSLTPGQAEKKSVLANTSVELIQFDLTAQNSDITVTKIIFTGFLDVGDSVYHAGHDEGYDLSSLVTAPCLKIENLNICHSFNDNTGQIIFPDLSLKIDKDKTDTIILSGYLRPAGDGSPDRLAFDLRQAVDITLYPNNAAVNDSDDNPNNEFISPNHDLTNYILIEGKNTSD